MNKKKKPKIRFKGFTEDWEQRSLGECFSERRESMLDGELISVTINDGIKKFSELDRHDNSNENKSKYKKVCIGDIAYNSMRMWQGASGYSLYEGIVSPAYTVLSPNEGIDSKCISYLFKRPDVIHRFQINSQGITSDNWNLKYPAFSKINISITKDIKEQRQIGVFFKSLDNLILIHQIRYEKLKNLKKSMLEKLFPKNEHNIPEVRFIGFFDTWKEYKFEELVKTRRGLTYKPGNIQPKGIRVLRSSNIEEDQFILKDDDIFVSEDAVNIEFVKENDILITSANGSSRLVGKHAIISKITEKSTVHGGFMLVGTTSDPNFINASMSSSWYKKFIELYAAGGNGAIGNLSKSDLDNQKILVPSEIEKKKIGDFFYNFDKLILLHEKQLEKLKNVKRSMLEKIFV